MDNFDKLVDHFLETDQLGHYSKEAHQIVLYGIEIRPEVLEQIKNDIEMITKRYKITLHGRVGERRNVGIIDIDL